MNGVKEDNLFDLLSDDAKDRIEMSTKQLEEPVERKSKLKELIQMVISSPLKVGRISESTDSGDVEFTVLLRNVGLTPMTYLKFKNELYSHYCVNLIGELLIRENMNLFAEKLTKIDHDNYSEAIENYEHKNFGMRKKASSFLFKFHISLLQDLLVEDFKKEVGAK